MVILPSVVLMEHHTTAFENGFFRARLACMAVLQGRAWTGMVCAQPKAVYGLMVFEMTYYCVLWKTRKFSKFTLKACQDIFFKDQKNYAE